jgi:hypothetical protein
MIGRGGKGRRRRDEEATDTDALTSSNSSSDRNWRTHERSHSSCVEWVDG